MGVCRVWFLFNLKNMFDFSVICNCKQVFANYITTLVYTEVTRGKTHLLFIISDQNLAVKLITEICSGSNGNYSWSKFSCFSMSSQLYWLKIYICLNLSFFRLKWLSGIQETLINQYPQLYFNNYIICYYLV